MDAQINFIFFDLPYPRSFDPLNADNGVNINAMRMLYLTPLEVSVENKLTSSVLESFSYSPEQKEITFLVSKEKKFSDGSNIQVDDVLLAILRMAWRRPEFPVVKEILGLAEWAKHDTPLAHLPSGITTEGQTIKIKLNRNVRSPLFRFTLELFSIIPSRCVDKSSGILVCERAPASGFYEIVEMKKDKIAFVKRDEFKTLPYRRYINFQYIDPVESEVRRLISDQNSILYGMDLRIKDGTLKFLQNDLHFEWLPASRFVYLSINPKIKPFDEQQCRQAFARLFREMAKKVFKEDLNLSNSIFTPIMSGYMSDEDLSRGSFAEDSYKKCLSKIAENKVPWHVSDINNLALSEKILSETMRNISLNLEPTSSDFSKRDMQFVEGESAFYAGSSGFWAEDPLGDFQMFFTKGLHRSTEFAAQSIRLRQGIEKIELDSNDPKEALQELNRTVYDESLLNVFLHSRRFFGSLNPDLLVQLPQAVSSPAFYQVVK